MSRTATSDRFAQGARIGDYVVDRELAYEASSIVYFATHVVLPRQAHIKVTHPGSRTAAIQRVCTASRGYGYVSGGKM